MSDDNVSIVAQKARKTFMDIRNLRKTMPSFTREQKDELKRKEKELQDQWWEDVKGYMKKDANGGTNESISSS